MEGRGAVMSEVEKNQDQRHSSSEPAKEADQVQERQLDEGTENRDFPSQVEFAVLEKKRWREVARPPASDLWPRPTSRRRPSTGDKEAAQRPFTLTTHSRVRHPKIAS
jgi:hypothetical protein